jgi:hypothetical protein
MTKSAVNFRELEPSKAILLCNNPRSMILDFKAYHLIYTDSRAATAPGIRQETNIGSFYEKPKSLSTTS